MIYNSPTLVFLVFLMLQVKESPPLPSASVFGFFDTLAKLSHASSIPDTHTVMMIRWYWYFLLASEPFSTVDVLPHFSDSR